jgi:hypothetical protein
LLFPNANTQGSLIVAYVIWNNAGGVSVTDTRGNAYAATGARRSSPGRRATWRSTRTCST